MTVKFQCINEQHAIVAALRMRGLGRKTVRLGRAVVSEGDWHVQVATIASQNMSRTMTPTEYDEQALETEGTL